MEYFSYNTIIGSVVIYSNRKAIARVCFGEEPDIEAERLETEPIKDACKQLKEYLSGLRKEFELELEYDGSDFQLAVWDQTRKIPYGKTASYKEIALGINRPKSCVAVGQACGKNPISIFIPCHRVIGSDGSLTGYGGGLRIKKRLLEIECRNTRG
ncbi:MAG: methylated-DNA--[protein]-cysteine S-methyltransferase [Holosporaceae bacterium]|nr:methylated-DNA--[protein]-cysteine S-methyltransferase [Holosporaceae bacterium]